MTHTKHSFLIALGCCFVLVAAGCGNSSSGVMTTSRGLSATGASTPRLVAADAPSPSDTATLAQAPASACAPCEQPAEPTPAAPRRQSATRSTTRAASPTTGAGLGVRRLVVARGVEDREPVGAASRFPKDNERIYAFVEATNRGGDAGELVVSFENESGDEVGNITLNIPASVPRWRTWAYSRALRDEGSWTAIIRTADGIELARERFEIEG